MLAVACSSGEEFGHQSRTGMSSVPALSSVRHASPLIVFLGVVLDLFIFLSLNWYIMG